MSTEKFPSADFLLKINAQDTPDAQLKELIKSGLNSTQQKVRQVSRYALEQVFATRKLNKSWLELLFSLPDFQTISEILSRYNGQIRQAKLHKRCYNYLKKLKQNYLAQIFL